MKKVIFAIAFAITVLITASILIAALTIVTYGDDKSAGIPILITALLFAALSAIIHKYYLIEKNGANTKNSRPTEPVFFPIELPDGQRLYKQYDHIEICVIAGNELNFKTLNIGDWLNFVKEPFNLYDNRAVAVYDGNQRIGYVYKGIGQDMTNDFLDQGNAILAKLMSIDKKQKRLHMAVAYYYKRRRKVPQTVKCPTCGMTLANNDCKCQYCGTVCR